MKCEWDKLLAILPQPMRSDVDRLGREKAQEIRLRLGKPPRLELGSDSKCLKEPVTAEDILFVINAASRYSPWAAETAAQGFLTAPGGHRIGLCGETVIRDGTVTGIRNPTSLCIRVARDFPGISQRLLVFRGSILILGAPGWGKTTLLRDLIRLRSNSGEHLAVVDERCELFPTGFEKGQRTDVLTGCPKGDGISRVLRTMSPDCIAVDEITENRDTQALISAAWCGVKLLATAHAASMEDFLARGVYSELSRKRIFDTIVILHQDKSWHTERSG